MKYGGRLHWVWWHYSDSTVGDYLWIWRPVCWRHGHDGYWNNRKVHCVICGKRLPDGTPG